MDPILAEIYSTVLTAAPYVIGAYVLMWLVLLIFIIFAFVSQKGVERDLRALEDALNLQQQDTGSLS